MCAETLSDDSFRGKLLSEASRKSRPLKIRRPSKTWRNLDTVKTLAGRLGQSSTSSSAAAYSSSLTVSYDKLSMSLSTTAPRDVMVHKNVKKAQTVGAQFQHSLQSLMVALNTANPFFVRCIKSNRLKVNDIHIQAYTYSRCTLYMCLLSVTGFAQKWV